MMLAVFAIFLLSLSVKTARRSVLNSMQVCWLLVFWCFTDFSKKLKLGEIIGAHVAFLTNHNSNISLAMFRFLAQLGYPASMEKLLIVQ